MTKLDSVVATATKADDEVDEFLSPIAETRVGRALSVVGEFGDQPQLRLISLAMAVGGLASSNKRAARAGIRMLVAHELATSIKSFVKHRVDRTRPRSANSTIDRKIKAGRSRAKEESSFPSGHTAGSVAVARALGREYPALQTAAIGSAAVISSAQIPKSAHYLTDVVVGGLIGTAAEGIIGLIWPRDGSRPRIHPSAEQVGRRDQPPVGRCTSTPLSTGRNRRCVQALTGEKECAMPRELIDTGTDKRYVRRDEKGQFKESDDVGRSLSQDQKRDAKTEAKKGEGDRGDR